MSEEPLQSRYADDPDLQELLAAFTAGLAETSRQLERAAQNGDRETLRHLAHQLKGSGGGYGYPAISEAAAQLTRALPPPEPEPEAAGIDETAREAAARLVQTLRRALAGRAGR